LSQMSPQQREQVIAKFRENPGSVAADPVFQFVRSSITKNVMAKTQQEQNMMVANFMRNMQQQQSQSQQPGEPGKPAMSGIGMQGAMGGPNGAGFPMGDMSGGGGMGGPAVS